MQSRGGVSKHFSKGDNHDAKNCASNVACVAVCRVHSTRRGGPCNTCDSGNTGDPCDSGDARDSGGPRSVARDSGNPCDPGNACDSGNPGRSRAQVVGRNTVTLSKIKAGANLPLFLETSVGVVGARRGVTGS